MHGRGGFPAKNIIFAVFIVLLIYMTYLYNGSQNRLREVEMTAARYKREADDRTTEIQDLVRAKDKAQENWQNEKFELNNRIKSINQQHSLLQGQYKEVEADLSKLKDDMDKMNQDNKDSQKKHHEEYLLMKQTKENELSSCRDELANAKRKSDELSSQAATLQENIQEVQKLLENTRSEARKYFRQLEQANSLLKKEKDELDNRVKELEGQARKVDTQTELKDQQQQGQVPATKLPQSLFQEQEKEQPKAFQKSNDVELMKMQKEEKENPFNQFDSLPAFDKKNTLSPINVPGRGGGDNQDHQKQDVEELNAKHQMVPPVHNQPLANDDELVRNGLQDESNNDLDKKVEVNPNDEQKAQIQEPALGLPEKEKDDVGLYGFERDKKEDEKEKVRLDDDAEAEHQNPLALGQIQGPQPGAVNAKNEGKHVGHPDIVNDNNDNVVDRNAAVGENQYFGEEDNGGDEDGRGVEDDQDREVRPARDADNQDQFQENDNAALDRANE